MKKSSYCMLSALPVLVNKKTNKQFSEKVMNLKHESVAPTTLLINEPICTHTFR